MDTIFSWLYDLLYKNDTLALVSSFGWGILSVVLSPCHLAALPMLVAYVANQNKNKTTSPSKLSILFSLGILTTILIIGLVTALLGRLLGDIGNWGNIFTGIVFLTAGLFFLELVSLDNPGLNSKAEKFRGGLFPFVLGLSAGLALGPCTFAFMAPVFAYGLNI
jgi:cytochrome c-type biogenesis protein